MPAPARAAQSIESSGVAISLPGELLLRLVPGKGGAGEEVACRPDDRAGRLALLRVLEEAAVDLRRVDDVRPGDVDGAEAGRAHRIGEEDDPRVFGELVVCAGRIECDRGEDPLDVGPLQLRARFELAGDVPGRGPDRPLAGEEVAGALGELLGIELMLSVVPAFLFSFTCMITMRFSITFSPTLGDSTRSPTPARLSTSGRPMPERSRSSGVSTAPSRRSPPTAPGSRPSAPCTVRTPVARVPSKSSRTARFPVWMSRFLPPPWRRNTR